MTIRTNPELAAIINAEVSQYNQVRALNTALTSAKRVKVKHHETSSTPQADVWASGTLVRDAALTGPLTFSDDIIVAFGTTSDLVTATSVDLATGIAVIRIEGNGHWVEGTIGLTGSGKDFIVAANPSPSNSFAFMSTARLYGSSNLPHGIPDNVAPTCSLASTSTNVTVAGNITLTATATDAVGVTLVEFYRDGVLFGSKTSAPYTQVDSLNYLQNGTIAYTARAYDAANNVGISSAVNVVVNIPEPVETGPATPVGDELTTVGFTNMSTSPQTNVPVTFGHLFKIGALPATDAGCELRAPDSSNVLCQMNVKTTHPDGSVRFAILSAIIPALAASATVTYSIRRKLAVAATALVPADFPGLNATATLTMTGENVAGPSTGTTYTADAAALLAAGTYETWLSGPVVSEWLVRCPLKDSGNVDHPDLHVRFNIRAYAGQIAKIDYIIENNWAKEKTVPSGNSPWESVSIAPKIYRFNLKAGAATVYNRSSNGYLRARLNNTSDTYDNKFTGLPNDSTVFTATLLIDGTTPINLSVTGSAAQTYLQLRNILNTQLAGYATCTRDIDSLGIRFTSNTTGPNSSVTATDYGTLFPALDHINTYRPLYGDEIIHYPRTRVKLTFWWNGAAPAVNIIHNKAYLIDTKGIPNYDVNLVGSTSVIASNLTALNNNSDINGYGIAKAYWPDVGYAAHIGIQPEWCAMWLLSQNPDARYTMLKQADLLGYWPIFWRDYDTDRPISFVDWPYATSHVNAGDSVNPATGLREQLPPVNIPTHIPPMMHRPDAAHHPDMSFMPYIATGDHFYMENILFINRFVNIQTNAHNNYRGGRKCLWRGDQPRGQAWYARTNAHASYIAPDTHPLRTDLAYEQEENRLWYEDNYVKASGQYHNIFGMAYHNVTVYTMGGQASVGMPPWMDDFLTASVGRMVELGFSKWQSILNFKSKMVAGRFTSGADFCWQLAAAYNIRIRATSTSPLYTSWSQIYTNSFDSAIVNSACGSQDMANALTTLMGAPAVLNTMTGYPDAIGGYPANTQPAVAYCASFNTPGGDDSWLVFNSRSIKPDYNNGPQFAIVPRT